MTWPVCSVDSCDRPVRNQKRGWCLMHYQRWYRLGHFHLGDDLHAEVVVASVDELAVALTQPATFATHNPFTVTFPGRAS